ncbi:Uncharacterised protein [Vibrio cholerae]|nr:Uncharacterised protein [Vibrio cholerae]
MFCKILLPTAIYPVSPLLRWNSLPHCLSKLITFDYYSCLTMVFAGLFFKQVDNLTFETLRSTMLVLYCDACIKY